MSDTFAALAAIIAAGIGGYHAALMVLDTHCACHTDDDMRASWIDGWLSGAPDPEAACPWGPRPEPTRRPL